MSTTEPTVMSSNRPYLLRAIYDWITDNGLTPYLLIDATKEGVQVPAQVIKNGQVVLNLAMRAVAKLDLGNEWITFQARFSGASHAIHVPLGAVLALYAQENGQGMMFPAEDAGGDPPPSPAPDTVGSIGDGPAKSKLRPPHLRIVK